MPDTRSRQPRHRTRRPTILIGESGLRLSAQSVRQSGWGDWQELDEALTAASAEGTRRTSDVARPVVLMEADMYRITVHLWVDVATRPRLRVLVARPGGRQVIGGTDLLA
jgi:hypothetical protein